MDVSRSDRVHGVVGYFTFDFVITYHIRSESNNDRPPGAHTVAYRFDIHSIPPHGFSFHSMSIVMKAHHE